MVKYNLLIIFIFILFSKPATGQMSNEEVKRTYNNAEQYFIDENYTSALPLYYLLDSMKHGDANISFKIGFCYLNSSTKKTKAIPFLEDATKDMTDKYAMGDRKEKQAPASAEYYLAKAYQLGYGFKEAIEIYTSYKERLGNAPAAQSEIEDVDHDIETCYNAIYFVAHPVNAVITNLGNKVNSEYTDAAPVVSLDEKTLIFTSKRESNYSDERYNDGQFYEDVYISQYVDGEWQKPRSISPNINTIGVEAALNLSTDGTKLLLYKDDKGDGNIYMSELKGNEWLTPKPISSLNSKSWETHACYSVDERILYFVSDRPGGKGGRDIYKSMKLPNGEWGPPQNLGDTINTKYDEDGIFAAPDGKTIYFSSKGHKSMGGFDIFKSTIDGENGFWTAPENIGYPLNTPDDDIFYVTTPDGKRAYLSTAKDGGYGEKDIYLVIYPDNEPRDLTVLVGKIVNKTSEDMANNKIVISTVSAKKGGGDSHVVEELVANGQTGKFGTTLSQGKSYNISYYINSKLFYTETIDVPYLGGYRILNREVPYDGTKK